MFSLAGVKFSDAVDLSGVFSTMRWMGSRTETRHPSTSMRKFLPLGLVVPLLLVTGCPSNQYSIDLTPRGNVIERKLVFYRADGTKSKGVPNYVGFDAAELARITSLYPQD